MATASIRRAACDSTSVACWRPMAASSPAWFLPQKSSSYDMFRLASLLQTQLPASGLGTLLLALNNWRLVLAPPVTWGDRLALAIASKPAAWRTRASAIFRLGLAAMASLTR